MSEPREVAVVTGGSSGIGLAIVERFLSLGYAVAFFSRTEYSVSKACERIRENFPGLNVLGEPVDLRDANGVNAFFSKVRMELGAARCLVNNAAISPKGENGRRRPLHELSVTEWDDVIRTNLTGAFLCTQCVLPDMMARSYGRIVSIGSLAGRTMPRIAGAAYAASKSGLAGLMRSVAIEYAAYGVTANTLCPGRILTSMTGGKDNTANQAVLQRIPIGRLGKPTDVAGMATYLCSEEGGFVSGATIDINGGEFAAP